MGVIERYLSKRNKENKIMGVTKKYLRKRLSKRSGVAC
jgi:hypothetical protein